MKKQPTVISIAKKFVNSDISQKNEISAYILGEENGKARVIEELKKLGVKIPEEFGKSNPSAVT